MLLYNQCLTQPAKFENKAQQGKSRCRSDPLVRLNGSLRQENLDGAAPTPPKFGIPLKEEV